MSHMIEVVYKLPQDNQREDRIKAMAAKYGGTITLHEFPPEEHNDLGLTLTIEFDSYDNASLAFDDLASAGERVEGPFEYGDD